MKKPLPPFIQAMKDKAKGKDDTKKDMPNMAKGKPFAKGGGVESKGKTKGMMVKMKSGGKAC